MRRLQSAICSQLSAGRRKGYGGTCWPGVACSIFNVWLDGPPFAARGRSKPSIGYATCPSDRSGAASRTSDSPRT